MAGIPTHMDQGDRCAQLNYDFKDFTIPKIVSAQLQAWTGPDSPYGSHRQTCFPVIKSVEQV